MKEKRTKPIFLRTMSDESGTSMLEVLVIVGVLGILLTATAAIVLTSHQHWQLSFTTAAVDNDLAKGLHILKQDIREAGAGGGNPAPSPITVSGPQNETITFDIPATVAAAGPTSWQSVQYALGGNGGTQLLRTDANGTDVIANNVSSLSFQYNPAIPRVVGITLSTTRNTINGRPIVRQLMTDITARN